jgi:DNA replication and repair protein RecF
MSFDEHVNIIYGDNAQGKTNILESLYVCATSKSHRGSKDKEIIAFGREDAHIKVTVRKNDSDYRIDMHLKKSKSKGIAVNGIPIRKAVELFGIINIVFFSPQDLDIIKDGPAERRRFMDMELSQLDKIYLNNLVNYNKVIVQRNKLLKDIAFNPTKESLDSLDVWDIQMNRFGAGLIKRRVDFIDSLNKIIGEIHEKLTGGTEKLTISYEPCVSEDRLAEGIAQSRERDIRLKCSNTGPHKDDITFLVNGNDVRKYGSQGQQRTVALSLKLAEIELVKQIIHDTPILLLDDVLSELDSSRQNYLLDSIGDIQTIVTCTGLEEFVNSRLNVNKIFKVVSGEVFSET